MSFLGLTAADAALGSGLLQAGTSIFGGLLGSSGQQATNAQQMAMLAQEENFNASEAWKNREWQEKMSNTAYERTMGDMKLAGLNPILAAGNGPNPFGSGATASISGTPSLGNPAAPLASGISSAGQAASTAAATKAILTQAEKDQSQVDLNKSTTSYTDANKALTDQLKIKAAQDTATSAAQQRVAQENADNVRQDTANKVIAGVIASHDANTAKSLSEIRAREAWDRTHIGEGPVANALSTAVRSTGTAIQGAAGAYSDYIGKPFSNLVGKAVDFVRGKHQ